ncbi:MAG TPA: M1 family metallopeptidase [Rhodothermales bacterium]|nr:M1 family metallopeptidase [Rhodothermales bacterium]
MKYLALLLGCLMLFGCGATIQAQRPSAPSPKGGNGWQRVGIMDSGGPLMPEQAEYDITYYGLNVRVDPAEQSIAADLTANARVVKPLQWFVLDLDTVYTISSVEALDEDGQATPISFERKIGKVWTDLGREYEAGEVVRVRVTYSGKPRVAVNPPWGGGFTWAKTPSGEPWVATSMQGEGADLWWPCKDHPSDEADSVAINVTVPGGLVDVSNGRSRGVTDNADGTKTYHWFVSTPINNYAVALNIAPYRTITETFHSVSGMDLPVTFWILPEAYDLGKKQLPEFLKHLAFYEKMLGPYPFRADKYGVAHTPYLGMEHQTIIAYGDDFDDEPWGYDWLHFHELGHEWWGNMVTAADWKDFWLHEGLTEYMQALYSEQLFGEDAYRKVIRQFRSDLQNIQPVAPRETQTTDQVYFIAGQDGGTPNNDIYYKGAVILNSLRYLIGDEDFFTLLRRFAYPTPALEQVTDGRQCRFVDTEDFVRMAEQVSGMKLEWFSNVYLRQAALPELVQTQTADGIKLAWKVPGDLPFPMPVDVEVDGQIRRVEMVNGQATIPATGDVVIDPGEWVLRK